MTQDHDREVIGRIAGGDEAALTEIFGRYAPLLYSYAVRMLGSADDASEAVSDLFLSACTDAARIAGNVNPAGTALVERLREILLRRSADGSCRHPSRDVDLWVLVLQGDARPSGGGSNRPAPGFRPPSVVRETLDRCGALSTSVLSLVYFGGYGVREAAARFFMSPAECRSRLHGCLEHLSGERPEGRPGRPHHARFSVCSAALALGAIRREEEPAYFEHLDGGCPECRSEVSRFAAAAHNLPVLLPGVKLPPELLDKILFSLRLALIAGSGPEKAPAPGGHERIAPEPPADARRSVRPAAAPPGRRGRSMAVACGFAAAAALIGVLGLQAFRLHRTVEEQSEILDALQERHTDLLLKYDRLAGISGFFESKGIVTPLNGKGDYRGLAGRLVWDSSGGSAMLQILNPPGGLQGKNVRINAVGSGAEIPLVEFTGDVGDTGDVFYRFFPLDVAPDFLAAGFTVDAAGSRSGDAGNYTEIMSGMIPGRQ